MLTLDEFQQGGWVMIGLLAASVAGLAAVLYCLLALRRRGVLLRSLVELCEDPAKANDPEAARARCLEEGGPFAEILLTVIETRTMGREEAESLVESAGRRASHELSRGLLVLEVVAAISPLMGLLGTVLGMYEVFGKIAAVGVREVGQLSGGISQALITTICGLIVAIPAYVAFTYFGRRVEDLVLEMERHAVHLMARLRGGGSGKAEG